jgi:hypothetical protein
VITVGHTEAVTATNWHKSSYSTQNGCVEVGVGHAVVGVRDSKLGAGSPVLAFNAQAWAAFLSGLKNR